MKVVKQKIALSNAIKILKVGGLVICPTDTVYGFLALAENKKAVNKIYKIKKRPKSKPLPIFVKNIKMAKEFAQISEAQEKILKKYWPGKYTFVLKSQIPNPNAQTVALRVPKYKFLNNLLNKINKPLVQTSVNISGQAPLTRISDIIEQFSKQNILLVDAGDLPKRKPSAIIDLTMQTLTRLR